MLQNVGDPVEDGDIVKDEDLLRKGIPIYAEKKRQKNRRRNKAENTKPVIEEQSLSVIVSKSENNELITEEIDKSLNVSQQSLNLESDPYFSCTPFPNAPIPSRIDSQVKQTELDNLVD